MRAQFSRTLCAHRLTEDLNMSDIDDSRQAEDRANRSSRSRDREDEEYGAVNTYEDNGEVTLKTRKIYLSLLSVYRIEIGTEIEEENLEKKIVAIKMVMRIIYTSPISALW